MLNRDLAGLIRSDWLSKPNPEPLLLFGAPRTGKSTLARMVAGREKKTCLIDLAEPSSRTFFLSLPPGRSGAEMLCHSLDKSFDPGKTLLIADHIHHLPASFGILRQLAEATPGIHVMGISGHLTDPCPGFSRLILRPLSFSEFLRSTGDQDAIGSFMEIPFPVSAFHRLLHLFNIHTLIGGMPSVVHDWITHRSVARLGTHFGEIDDAFGRQLDALGGNSRRRELFRLTLLNAFPFASERITFRGFGNSPYGSRDIRDAFLALERIMAVQRIYPVTSATAGLPPDTGRAPRLQIADTGLLNHAVGIQRNLLRTTDLAGLFQGRIVRHMAGQELLSGQTDPGARLTYWVRAKLQSGAETDYVVDHEGLQIPVMVRPGEPGRLRSLHQFLDEAPHPYAVRLHTGNVSIRQGRTIAGKRFFLLNLPYFLAGKIHEHLKGFIRFVNT